VFGVARNAPTGEPFDRLAERLTWRHVDLNEGPAVRDLLAEVRPDWILHLAAQASVARAWADPAETLTNNITAQLNLLQAVVALGLHPRILVVSSSDVYGRVRPEDLPVDEDTPLRPVNPYAVSKIAQEYLGYQYHLSHRLDVIRMRPFNHIGPGQGTGFAVPDFASQIAAIEAGRQEPVLRVGDLTARRDFTDVRDVVRGYELALRRGEAGGIYNLGSGRSYAVGDILQRLLSQSRVAIRVEPDLRRLRPSDVPEVVCDSRRFAELTGWAPQYDLDHTLRDVLAYWRRRTQ
jgi:GDP-4-dehydro-6-deoxy-D-mannose reductase